MPDSLKLGVRVTSAYGNSHHYADHVDSGQFAFHPLETGNYYVCFWADDHKPQTTITVDFDWMTGVPAKDWPNGVKKGAVEVIELQLKRLYQTVISIHEGDVLSPLKRRRNAGFQCNKKLHNGLVELSLSFRTLVRGMFTTMALKRPFLKRR